VERAVLVAVDYSRARHWSAQSSIDELGMLAKTAGALPVERLVQRLKHPDPHSYVGKGKLNELIAMRSTLNYSVAIFDDELSPAQQRTLENELGVKVIDRTALILDIFAQRARTSEGALQVALAQHEYLLPRLTGQWSHLERMEGAIGLRGPGETQLETDRRLIRGQIKKLKQRLQQVRRQRDQYRGRREKAGIPVVALVGYTNAGKSTLMNAMTGADVRVNDRLFETLDPVTRRCRLDESRTVLLTDTVGFIQKLPTQLIAAFRATLEELNDADLLLHVVDITHPDAADQSESVEETLAELKMLDRPRLTVLNKVDRLADVQNDVENADGAVASNGRVSLDGARLRTLQAELAESQPDAVLVSAETGWGLEGLKQRVGDVLSGVEPVASKGEGDSTGDAARVGVAPVAEAPVAEAEAYPDRFSARAG
jgi:GTP-binding protein HflX